MMSQQVKSCLSDLLHLLHIEHTHLNDTVASASYVTTWHLAMMTALPQIAAYSMVEQNNLHL